mgnify:CR=1 FL=1
MFPVAILAVLHVLRSARRVHAAVHGGGSAFLQQPLDYTRAHRPHYARGRNTRCRTYPCVQPLRINHRIAIRRVVVDGYVNGLEEPISRRMLRFQFAGIRQGGYTNNSDSHRPGLQRELNYLLRLAGHASDHQNVPGPSFSLNAFALMTFSENENGVSPASPPARWMSSELSM